MALLSTLTDRFDGYPDPYLWVVERGDPQPVDGRLLFFGGGTQPGTDTYMRSVDSYTFDRAGVQADLPRGDDPDYYRSFNLQVAAQPTPDNPYAPLFEFYVFNDTLYCQWSGYSRSDEFGYLETPYDPVAHLWLRMLAGADGGLWRVDYQVSPDGFAWASLGAYVAPLSQAEPWLYQVRLTAFYGPAYLAYFNLDPPGRSVLRVKQPGGAYALTGTRARPLFLRMPDGRLAKVDGSGRTPVYQRQPDGTWRIVAYRAALQ